VAGCCECGDEPSGSCATDLVILALLTALSNENFGFGHRHGNGGSKHF
jgi:hypothetical protein